MILKTIASFLITSGCGYLGIFYAKKFKDRVNQLEDFHTVLNNLKFNITFLKLPLHDALAINSRNKIIKNMLILISKDLKKSSNSEVGQIWKTHLSQSQKKFCLLNEDLNILYEFSKNLGNGDIENETNNIELAIMKLKIAENIARQESHLNTRFFKSVGFLVGISLVVLLL